MLEIRPDGSLKAENDLGIRKNFAVNGVRSMKPIPEIQTILEQFHEVFQGIGNIFDKKKKKKKCPSQIFYEIRGWTAQKARLVPYYPRNL